MKRTIVVAGMLVAIAAANVGAGYAPLLFTVLDIDSATSLPWNSPRNYLGIVEGYDVHHLVADTERLLKQPMPTIVRMETLRRAAVYASRDAQAAEQLVAFVVGKVSVLPVPGPPDPMALFDAGYVLEVLQELQHFEEGTKFFWQRDPAVVRVTRPYDGWALLKQSAALRPDDPSIQFTLGLMLPREAAEPYFRRAREGARTDALLANNLARLQLLQ